MMQVSLLDQNWAHIGVNSGSFVGCDAPTNFRWDRMNIDANEILVLTDQCIDQVDQHNNKYKICMLGEPRVIAGDKVYDYARNNWNKFDIVLTHEKKLLDSIPNGLWYAFDGSFIPINDWQIYPKTKDKSIIGSEKRWTYGHIYRREIIGKLTGQFDIWGRSYKPFNDALDPLKDYRFSVIILNCDVPYYWTDRLTDCFHTGTIPIFWNQGKWINNYFNPDGMFTFGTTDELEAILKDISVNGEAIYSSKMAAIQDNYNYELNRGLLEDTFYNKYFSRIHELVRNK